MSSVASTRRAPESTDMYPVRAALWRDAGDVWDNEYAGSVSAMVDKLGDPRVKHVRINSGLGLPTYGPYPSPGELLAQDPLWVEATMGIVGPQRTPDFDIPGGVLFEKTHSPWEPGLVAASYAFTFKGMAVAVPGRTLFDREAFDNGGLGFADVQRARHGLATAADCSPAQLLEMDAHVTFLADRYWVRCLKSAPGAVEVRGNFDMCQTSVEFGTEGLRAALGCTVADISGRALTDAVSVATRDRASKLANFHVGRGAFFALRALRLAAMPSKCR